MSELTRVLSPRGFVRQGRSPSIQAVVVCAGDSITHGLANASYVRPLQVRLASRGFQVVNAGKSGDLAVNLLRRIDSVIACQPDVVVVLIGTNDVAAQIDDDWRRGYERQKKLAEPPTLETFRAALDETVTRLKATPARIALIEIPPLGEDLESVHNQRVATYNAVVHESAAAHGVPVLPLFDVFVGLLPAGHRPTPFDGSKRWMGKALLRRLVLRQDWDTISARHGLALLADHVHPNNTGAIAITELVEAFVLGSSG